MGCNLSIYKGSKIEISVGRSSHDERLGWFDLQVTEPDGSVHEITVHFDNAEGFARAKQIAHLAAAVCAKEDA